MTKEKRISAKKLNAWAKEHYEDYDELMAEADLEIRLEIRIKEIRKSLKMTQKDLAKKMNTKQSNISKFEQDLSHVQINTLRKLAVALSKTMKITFEDVVPT
jgi:DNA-binding XRE family transcriptional regulator